MQTFRRLAGPLALTVVVTLLAACSNAGAPATGAPSDQPTASIPPSASPTAPPPASDGPGGAIGTQVPPGGDTPSDPGGADGRTFVVPKPGQLDPHPVRMDGLSASLDGRHVVVTAMWTSGVEPCNVLDTVIVAKGDHAFTITLREGHGPEDVACIEIAQLKATRIDLGDLASGTYTISDSQAGVAPISVVVP